MGLAVMLTITPIPRLSVTNIFLTEVDYLSREPSRKQFFSFNSATPFQTG